MIRDPWSESNRSYQPLIHDLSQFSRQKIVIRDSNQILSQFVRFFAQKLQPAS